MSPKLLPPLPQPGVIREYLLYGGTLHVINGMAGLVEMFCNHSVLSDKIRGMSVTVVIVIVGVTEMLDVVSVAIESLF